MIRDELRRMRHSFNSVSRTERGVYGIIIGMILLTVGGLINLAPIGAGFKITLFTIAIVALAFISLCIYQHLGRDFQSVQEEDEKKDRNTSSNPIPPMPDYTPTVGASSSPKSDQKNEEDIDRRLLAVLESIDRSNKAAEQRRIQEDEERRHEQERISELMSSTTVHYDEIPGFIFFVKRGLWQVVAALLTLALVINFSLADGLIAQGESLFVVLIFLVCAWVSARAIFDWRWTRRRIVGIRIKVWEPRNAFFLLFGNEAEASIFDCGNAVVKKTKYERLLLLRTATVSIDTPRKNTENDKDNGDVFNALENMRQPYLFRDIVMDLHEKLTMSQSNTIKRSNH